PGPVVVTAGGATARPESARPQPLQYVASSLFSARHWGQILFITLSTVPDYPWRTEWRRNGPGQSPPSGCTTLFTSLEKKSPTSRIVKPCGRESKCRPARYKATSANRAPPITQTHWCPARSRI